MAEPTVDPRTMTILMVDDNLGNIRLLVDMLTSRGYNVQQATSGQEALTLVQQQLPDIILLDIFMPGMDGYQVCSQLKADARTRDIPVIFISALADVDDIVRGFDAGGVDYITKPFKFKEVLARVANHLMLVQQRREIQALREQDRQHYESLAHMRDRFVQMATHDLRNPLNVILGYLHLLDRLEVAPKDQELLREIQQTFRSSVQKMRQLVADILELAQIETGLKLNPKPVQLADFLSKSLSGFALIAREKNITLQYTPPAQDVTLTVDVNALTRAIDNLVSNAVKYTPPGGQVLVTASVVDRQALIAVQDTGLGIPEKDLPHVFEAFYRVDQGEHSHEEGSGLGLSIVKTIVEQHQGTIGVQSEPGKGSTFTIRLPLSQEPAVPAPPFAPTVSADVSSGGA